MGFLVNGNEAAGFKTIDGKFESGMKLSSLTKTDIKGKLLFEKIDESGNGTLSRQEIVARRHEELADLKMVKANYERTLTSLKTTDDTKTIAFIEAKIQELDVLIQQEELITQQYEEQLKQDKTKQQEQNSWLNMKC